MPKNISKTELIIILSTEFSLDVESLKCMTFEAIKQKAIDLGVF